MKAILKGKAPWVILAVAAVVIGTAIAIAQNFCFSAYFRYGMVLRSCPSGKLRQTCELRAEGLKRGGPGKVTVRAVARYLVADEPGEQTEAIEKYSVALALVDAAGQETVLSPKAGWKTEDDVRTAEVELPAVADGEYVLRAHVESRVGKDTVDAPVSLYAPARIHVITDRPLYEPGNEVRFRAVALRARDLAPLDARPGRWIVKDPTGEILLEEKAPAGPWGVVAGSFPLDREAATGDWRVSWRSGDASDEVTFRVEPFTLPRFRVEATADRPFYRAGDAPRVDGAVVYSSGAPVAGAGVEITWFASGAWPPPTGWLEEALPRRATTGADGRFKLELPRVPADLRDQVRLAARVAAVDPAGDRVEAGTSLLLSEDPIQVSAVTELADGLVQGFNNRLYLRVATADGRPLVKSKIKVQRAWDPQDPGVAAETDEDGVASLQLDPGPAVNIVIPAMPARPAPPEPAVTRDSAEDLLSSEGVSLEDQVAMDRWLPELARCAKWAGGSDTTARVGLRISAAGAVVASGGGPTRLEGCVLGVLRARRLPAGRERMLSLSYSFGDADLPQISTSLEAALSAPDDLGELLDEAARGARDCMPADAEGALGMALAWQVERDRKEVALAWIPDPQGEGGAGARATACAVSAIARAVALDEPAEADGMGILRLSVEPSERTEEARPQPTIMTGYELLVSAEADGAPAGATKLRMTPGSVPALRLRASPVLASAGESIAFELLRGPGYEGAVPEEIVLTHLKGEERLKVDQGTRKASLVVDPKLEGWLQADAGSARALIYVRPAGELAVTVKPEQDRYAPGETAQLKLQTVVGGQGAQAAVGLFGVDDSLAQLATLAGPDDMGRLRPAPVMSAAAFGVLDGQALALGRIRGANAAAAAVLRVSSVPAAPDLDAVVSASGESPFDPEAELTDRFFLILPELHVVTRAWEASAPSGEQMKPATMARLWEQALVACAKRGESVTDAYGRRLRLSMLPDDLLELTDPRAVVIEGTRLPEDVEDWAAWVKKERP